MDWQPNTVLSIDRGYPHNADSCTPSACAVFTNRTDDATLVAVATQDTHGPGGACKIATLRDAFADYVPLDRHLFLACSPFTIAATPPAPPPASAPLGPWKRPRADAATAVAAALRCAPIIRYQRGSQRAADLARAADEIISVRCP